MCNKKKKDSDYKDNGETVANMNVEGFSWYQSEKTIKQKKMFEEMKLTPKERRAIVWGAFVAYLPIFLVFIGSFIVIYLLFYFLA